MGLEGIEDVLEGSVEAEGEEHAGAVEVVGVFDDDVDDAVLRHGLEVCRCGVGHVQIGRRHVVAVEGGRSEGRAVGCQSLRGLAAGATSG